MLENIITDKELNVKEIDFLGREYYCSAYELKSNDITNRFLLYSPKPINELEEPLPLRINSACSFSDLFGGSNRCDCKWQLDYAIDYIQNQRNGLIIYGIDEDGRAHGTINKLKSYKLMDKKKMSTCDSFKHLGLKPENRIFESYSSILNDLKIKKVTLITNNPDKLNSLRSKGIEIIGRIPIINQDNNLQKYLSSKQEQFGHLIYN